MKMKLKLVPFILVILLIGSCGRIKPPQKGDSNTTSTPAPTNSLNADEIIKGLENSSWKLEYTQGKNIALVDPKGQNFYLGTTRIPKEVFDSPVYRQKLEPLLKKFFPNAKG
jgi:hypothetical protein